MLGVVNQKFGPKISWKDPAAVVMVERDPHEVVGLVHGTTMPQVTDLVMRVRSVGGRSRSFFRPAQFVSLGSF